MRLAYKLFVYVLFPNNFSPNKSSGQILAYAMLNTLTMFKDKFTTSVKSCHKILEKKSKTWGI